MRRCTIKAADCTPQEAAPAQLVEIKAAKEHRVSLLDAVAAAFRAMQEAAAADDIRLVAVSGFRSIERQTQIWNRKITAAHNEGLSDAEAVLRVIEYSAPPGLSRHHWGTDLDLVGGALHDAARLEVEDWEVGGVCADEGRWLAEHAADFGFLRPYDRDRGGFLPEPWHWSHVTLSAPFLRRAMADDHDAWLQAEPFALAPLVRPHWRRLLGNIPGSLR